MRPRTYRVVKVTATSKTWEPDHPYIVQGSGYYRAEWIDVARFRKETAAIRYIDDVLHRQEVHREVETTR